MSYYRASDHWEDDTRLAGMSWISFGTWHALQAYGSRGLTDTIPPGVPFARFSKYAKPLAVARERAEMIRRGLLEETPDGGLVLVGFAEFQRLETRRARREADRLRKEQARLEQALVGALGTPSGRPEDALGTPSGALGVSPEGPRAEAESLSHTQNGGNVRADVRNLSVLQERETEREEEKHPPTRRTTAPRARSSRQGRVGGIRDLEQVTPTDFIRDDDVIHLEETA